MTLKDLRDKCKDVDILVEPVCPQARDDCYGFIPTNTLWGTSGFYSMEVVEILAALFGGTIIARVDVPASVFNAWAEYGGVFEE